jgi:hypothetical protein
MMKDQFYSNHGDLTLAQKQQIVAYLIADRMSNYGYDWKTFKRMSSHRSQLRAMLRLADINKLDWLEADISRFHFRDGTLVDYVVAQSCNEEITRKMRALLALPFKWN